MPQDTPPGWGDDPLTKFFEAARNNKFATFANLKSEYGRLRDIDKFYRDLVDVLDNSHDWFAGFFLLRAHSAFLAACRLATSGQVAECYMMLRGCLEAALYGLYLSRNPESQSIWLERHVDGGKRRRCRNTFAAARMLACLESESARVRETAGVLYERTIDYGAHPNERAILTNLKMDETEEHVKFDLEVSQRR